MKIRKINPTIEEDIIIIAKLYMYLDQFHLNKLGLKELYYGGSVNDLEAYKTVTKQLLTENEGFALLAENEHGEGVGFILILLHYNKFGHAKTYAEQYLIAVAPHLHHQGIGQGLQNAAEQILIEQGVTGMTSEVAENNQVSLDFHQHNGFNTIATWKEMYKPLNDTTTSDSNTFANQAGFTTAAATAVNQDKP